MKYSFEQVEQMLQALEDIDPELNEWEQTFLESIKENRKDLSEKQTDCLNKIYDKASGGGAYVKKQYFKR